MALFLNKILPLPFLPLGASVLLLLWALFSKRRLPAVCALLVLWVSSMPWTGDALLGRIERTYPRIEVRDCPAADAVVVLGGYLSQANGSTSAHPEFGEASERLLRGVDLWKAGRTERLVFSGARIPWLGSGLRSEGDVAAEVAVGLGVAPGAIVRTGAVQNTAGEAVEIARLARERQWKTIVLVTSAFHLPRAMEQFERAGVKAVPFPCDWRVDRERPMTPIDFLPAASGLGATEMALREWYGRLFYALKSVFAD